MHLALLRSYLSANLSWRTFNGTTVSLLRLCSNKKPGDDVELPPEPTSCCMRGCTNCVWVEYAKEIYKLLEDNDEKVQQHILSKIQDPTLKSFLQLELKSLQYQRDKEKEEAGETGNKDS